MIAKLYIYHLVDMAEEFDIQKLKEHLKELKLRPLKLTYFTPAYLNFTDPPVETTDDPWPISLTRSLVETQIKYHSFGSITIRYGLEIEGKDYGGILDNAQNILKDSSLFDEKTKQLAAKSRELVEKELAIKTYNGFMEDYAILWIQDKYNAVKKKSIKGRISRFLRNEEMILSDYEQDEAFRYNFSYTPNDLTVVDWDRAITIADKPDDDVWDVLEYTNLQLLQLRYYEKELDKRLKEIYQFSRTTRIGMVQYYGTHNLLKKTLEIYVEFTSVENRINSFLRLTGDEYLSRIYHAASVRLNMKSTQENIRKRLVDAKELYGMLSEEASAKRAEFLEIIIILLIAFEIIYAFI